MTISLANRLYRSGGLSKIGAMVVALIDGGQQWLDWAMQDPQSHYHFEDEAALMEAIQVGMHGTSLMVLPVIGLLVSPIKLMTLAYADLTLLSRVKNGLDIAPADLQSICEVHNLLPQCRFIGVRTMLTQFGLSDEPLFQIIHLDEWQALACVSAGLKDHDDTHVREAASFAIDKARTPHEFCDYYQMYLDCARCLGVLDANSQARAAAANNAVETLLALSFATLDSPKVDRLVTAWEVKAAISQWQLMGRGIGFPRASLMVQQMVAHGGYRGQTGSELTTLVRSYVSSAQLLLATGDIGHGRMGQDGASCRFVVTTDKGSAVIELERTGLLALLSFVPGMKKDSAKTVEQSAL